jgi:hypothetical protein
VLLRVALPSAGGAEGAGGGEWRGGAGQQLWSPGPRAFVGPPVLVPKRHSGVEAGGTRGGGEGGGGPAAPRSASPLPPLQSELDAAAEAAQAGAGGSCSGGGAGWIVACVYDAAVNGSTLVVLDGERLSAGPVATLRLPAHVPHPSAATWAHGYHGPGGAAPAGWRPRGA